LAADLGFVTATAVPSPETPVRAQGAGGEVTWDRRGTMCALGISLGFRVTVPSGSIRVVSEPHVILRGGSES